MNHPCKFKPGQIVYFYDSQVGDVICSSIENILVNKKIYRVLGFPLDLKEDRLHSTYSEAYEDQIAHSRHMKGW